MSLPKKIVVGVAFYLVLLLAFFVFVNGFPLHRREFDRAFSAWLHSPNPQTEALLHAESRKTMMIELETSACAVLVLWVTGLGRYEAIRRFFAPSDNLIAKLERA